MLQPWEQNPRELASWLTMLQISAYMYMYCGRALREIKHDCLVASMPFGDEPVFHLAAPVDERARSGAIRQLGHAEPEFRKVGLNITADMTKDLIAVLKDESQPRKIQNYQWLINEVGTIERLADKELKCRFFLYVPAERARFWPTMEEPHIFGEEVSTSFPSATFDISNSGICIATMMSTAAVFHLMRALEIGLAALGEVFGVSLAHTNWAPAIEQIESKIRGMQKDQAWKALPDCKEQQEFYAQAASHFAMFKDAWRNYTMHVRAKYTEDEAEMIFLSVKAFMQKLATRVSE